MTTTQLIKHYGFFQDDFKLYRYEASQNIEDKLISFLDAKYNIIIRIYGDEKAYEVQFGYRNERPKSIFQQIEKRSVLKILAIHDALEKWYMDAIQLGKGVNCYKEIN
ncbi:hypothetical protein [Rhizosphaericola mali]|uniref:Uncharacterized protein n=1 Tax=Rhizosphaericola mali TaxID=2545455 RepID=A0A5P2G4A7_9BACT|nr:hypothetical protein [Rhizosphaericola mali]QES90345.1 hypothetical protein E0W69_017360 [Rhizosphaericola mali]